MKRKFEIEEELGHSSLHELDEAYEKRILKGFNHLITIASFEQQKMLLQFLIEKIEVNKQKKIEKIDLKINEQLQAEILQQALSDQLDRAFSIYLEI